MYRELAQLWPLISPPGEYAEEAELYRHALVSATDPPPRTVLELGSGGGSNASFLKEHFDMTLVDLSTGMLEVSRRLNPECAHVHGDMRSVRLGRTFDAVFVHDAVMYMTSAEDLRQAMETAWVHCRPGGSALFVPDWVRETFRPATTCGGSDGDGAAVRYLENAWDPDPSDDTYLVDYVYLIRDGAGEVRVVHDRHVEGLFARDVWLSLLGEVGFQAEVRPSDVPGAEAGVHEMFVARKPR